MEVVTVDTPQLGDRSYLVHDGEAALVIDPQRDTDRIEEAARGAGVRITHVAETHLHNDYVTGGLVLARAHGAAYIVGADEHVSFEHHSVADRQEFRVGTLSVTAVATPGHTHHHMAYIVRGAGRTAVFSGGSLLYGSVGRTDLVAPDHTEGLARDQYASVRRLAEEAGPEAELYPTHGFGSFCSIGPASRAASSTVGEQLRANHALTDPDVDHFVAELLENLTAYPAYYAHMAPLNAHGPGPARLAVPEPLDAHELTHRLEAGEWVIDVRRRVAFASSHLRGSVSFEYGRGTSFTVYVGWVIPWGQKLTLVGPQGDVEKAVRDLTRIGIESADAAIGDTPGALAPGAELGSYPRAGWAELANGRQEGDVVLDVRREEEHAEEHVAGSVNVPLHELLGRLDDVPPGRVWVHCTSGYRAGVGASLLAREGRDVVLVDARFERAGELGVPLERGGRGGRPGSPRA